MNKASGSLDGLKTGEWCLFSIGPCTHRLLILAITLLIPGLSSAQDLSLQKLVTPSTIISKDGHPVTFSIRAFIEFDSLKDAFPYIESQAGRWPNSAAFDSAARQSLRRRLLHEAIESRVVSMTDERPLEILVTHTALEVKEAIALVKESLPTGYAEAFLDVQEKWKHSLNCWSAAPSIPARVLSNWYPIEEGIVLYGATYDSTEHFWQAVKYHPEVTVAQLADMLDKFQHRDWKSWLAHLDGDPELYLTNPYAVEFLRHNPLRNGCIGFVRSLIGKDCDRPIGPGRCNNVMELLFDSAHSKRRCCGEIWLTFSILSTCFLPPGTRGEMHWRSTISMESIWASARWVSSARTSALSCSISGRRSSCRCRGSGKQSRIYQWRSASSISSMTAIRQTFRFQSMSGI